MTKGTKLLNETELLTLTEKVVNRYAYAIPKSELEDVRMGMVEKYLQQEGKIAQGFKGNSQKSTYAYAVLNRMCCSIIRQEFKHWQNTEQSNENDAAHSTSILSSAEQLLIDDEIRYLRKCITLLNDKYKAVIFIAFYFLLKARMTFISVYDKAFQEHGLLQLLNPDKVSSKGEIFENLALVQNKAEEKNVKADAVRMWLNKEMKRLIGRMNGPFGRANYNNESFQILFEYFYNKE